MQKSPDVPDGPEYGPHPKLSRGDKQCSLQKEMKYVKERKFIYSPDLFQEFFSDDITDHRFMLAHDIPLDSPHVTLHRILGKKVNAWARVP